MIKVLTAYHKAHEKYLDDCQKSVSWFSAIRSDLVHDMHFDWGKGKAWAMNNLLSRVNDDDIVCVLDADDMAEPKMFNNTELLKDYDLVYGDVMNLNIDHNGRIYKSQPFDAELFKRKNFIPFSGTVMKGWLAKSEPYPDYFPVEDWVWWHGLLKHTDKFHYEPGIVARRRDYSSTVKRDIPVYSKVRRLMRNHKAKMIIKSIHEVS